MASSSLSKKKLTLREFVWYGFNYTAAISFVGGLYGTAQANNSDTSQLIGLNSIWIFIVVGLIAGICAWAFAKLSRIHRSNNNGGAYIYTRSSFGKFVGFIILFMQYVGMPFLITLQILFLFKGTFNPDFSGSPIITAKLGPFSDLYLDIIGIVIYIGAAIAIFWGIRMFKRLSNVTLILKWVTAGVLVLAAIYLAAKSGSGNYQYWTHPGADSNALKINFVKFIAVFNAFFFYFAGFETFSTAGRNIENPERNIGKGIVIIMFICTLFYIAIAALFFGAFGQNQFSQNMSISTWTTGAGIKSIAVLKWFGIVFMIISALAMKIQIAMANGIYGGTLLQPMGKEGILPDKLRKLSRDNLPLNASKVNLFISGLMICLWLIIPDLIAGIKTMNLTAPPPHYQWAKYGIDYHDYTSYKIPGYSLNMFTAASSAITLIVYGAVVLAATKLGFQNKLKINWAERILFPITFVFIVFMFGYHYEQVFVAASKDQLTGIIEIVFVLVSFFSGVCIYNIYYLPKYRRRLSTKPQLQALLNLEFTIIDDWDITSLELRGNLQYYLKRNLALHQNKYNKNYILANSIKKELDVVIDRYNIYVENRKKHDNDPIDE